MKNKLLFFVVIFVGATVLFIPFISRGFLTRYALQKTEEMLQTRIELASASLYLLQGSLVIQDVKVFHPDRKQEEIISVRKVEIKLKPWPMIFGDLAGLEFSMDHPKLVYATTRTGSWELSDRIPLLRRGKGEVRFPVNIDEISMKNGKVEYRDGKVGKTTRIEDIDVKVTHGRLPTPKDRLPAKFKMDFDIEGGGDFMMEGRADFLSSKVSFDSQVSLSGLPLPPYAPYYDAGIPVRITRGTMALASHAKCEKDYLNAPGHVSISGMEVEPKSVKIFGFASNVVVGALKDKRGNLEMDVLITGNIRNPQFHVMNDFSEAFVKSLSHGLIMAIPNTIKDFGEGVGKGVESGFEKFKGLFKR